MTPNEFLAESEKRPKKFEEEFIGFIMEVSKESATSTVAFWRDAEEVRRDQPGLGEQVDAPECKIIADAAAGLP